MITSILLLMWETKNEINALRDGSLTMQHVNLRSRFRGKFFEEQNMR
jgi:hypothetical protein